jgi:hypothetical protein
VALLGSVAMARWHLFIDHVHARDAKSAEDIAAKEHQIRNTLRDRLVAIREEQ